jgi:hypothetical protein
MNLKVSSQTRFAQHICFNIKEIYFYFLRKMMDKNIWLKILLTSGINLKMCVVMLPEEEAKDEGSKMCSECDS